MVEEHPKPLGWEKVYIFVSSTFNDMHAERDYLVKRVFPELQDWCERRKLRLVDIDLRWGVTEADASGKRAVKVCLERINDCRPFFICFLGQRHGWTPGGEGISEDTFDKFPGLRDSLHPAASVTELEIRHAILKPFSSRDPEDRNRLIEYQPSECAFFYFRDPRYLKHLRGSLRQLRCTYTDHFGPENETDREFHQRDLSRRALSALRKLIRPAAAKHRRLVYRADWRDELRTPELAMPFECSSVEETSIDRWRDQWNRFAHLDLTETELSVPEEKQSAADGYNAALTRGRLADFRSLEEARGQFPSGSDLACIIQHDLQQAILTRFPKHAEVEEEGELQKEIDQQEQFLFSASEGFIEREGDFADLDDYVESDSNKHFVLTAAGGMGKSTLLANWVDRYRRGIEGRRDHSIHFRFIGQSDGTTTVYSLLRFLLQEIKEIGHKLDEEIPLDPIKLRNEWPVLLEAIGKRGQTVIVIDALDQLESGLSDVRWLPRQLPDNIKLIVSFKRGDPPAEELFERFSESNHVRLSEVKPFQNLDDRRRLVRTYLSQYLKELDAAHLETLINLRGAENPLYLKVVLSELRVFGAYANLAAKIDSDFGDNPVSAFVRVLERLENDPAYSPIDPKRAVPLLFGLLAHARRGLSVDELTSLFIQALGLDDTKEWREAAADTVNLFLREVRSFLARREGHYDFFFGSFKKAAQQCYVAEGDEETISRRSVRKWHRLLATYFQSLPTWQEAAPSSQAELARQSTRRKVAELPHHLIQAGQWQGVEETLCDLDFIEAKCAARMTYDLVADYHLALAAIDGERARPGRDRISEFSRFVQGQAHVLSAQPNLTFQQAANQPDSTAPAAAAERLWESGAEKRPWIRWVNKPQARGACLMTLAGHSSYVSACAYSPDGRRLVSASGDNTLKVWDAETGEAVTTLAGHSESVAACAYSPDGRRIVSASWDQTLKVWDAETGQAVATLAGHSGGVSACAYSPNGRRIVSACFDKTLKVWDAERGEAVATLAGHSDFVYACAYSPDGRRIVSASGKYDATLKVWDAETGEAVATLAGHLDVVNACAYSPDGRRIVSASMDRMLRLWDAETGEAVATLAGHSNNVKACSYSPDGRRIVSASGDTTLRMWNAETGEALATLAGHSDSVEACGYSRDGQRIVSASEDTTLKVWDAETGNAVATLAGHLGKVSACAYSPDGRRIVSASRDDTLKVWDAETREASAPLAGHSDTVWACAYSPDGRRIVSASGRRYGSRQRDATLKVWDAETGQAVATLAGHFGSVDACAYSPDGRRIVSASWDYTLKVWDAETGEEVATLVGHSVDVRHGLLPPREPGALKPCAYSPDGRRVLSASWDGTLKVWDAETGRAVTTLAGHESVVTACTYSPDGRRIVSASGQYDATLKVWDAGTGEAIATLAGHSWEVNACAYSPDGRRIVSASQDKTLRVWDAETGEAVATLARGGVSACAYSPDARRIVSASRDNTLEVLDAETGRSILSFFGGPFCCAALGPRQCLAAGDEAGRLYILHLLGLDSGPTRVTPVRIWHFRPRRWWNKSVGVRPRGSWDSAITAVCKSCGRRFSPPPVVLDTILGIARNVQPPHRLPNEAWDEPRLLSECPHCYEPLRFNPFIVDNRERY